MNSKPWFRSKTVISALVMLFVAVYNAYTGNVLTYENVVTFLTAVGFLGLRQALN